MGPGGIFPSFLWSFGTSFEAAPTRIEGANVDSGFFVWEGGFSFVCEDGVSRTGIGFSEGNYLKRPSSTIACKRPHAGTV